jgi:nicotinate-nucleotide adenylyltransferase
VTSGHPTSGDLTGGDPTSGDQTSGHPTSGDPTSGDQASGDLAASQPAIGIFGGTFDPIHLGHLALAREARDALGLSPVLFVPNADPPHKQDQSITAAGHRAAMVALAIGPEAGFELSRIELDRAGPSYAVDTAAQLAQRSSREGRPEPWFLLSAEALDTFDTWRQPERLLELVRVAVAPRPGADPVDAAWVRQRYPGREDRFAFLPGPELDIAATDIRERVAAGRAIDDLVPAPVADYIAREGLYRPRSADA